MPRFLQTIPGDNSTSTHHSLDPTTPGRVGESLVQPPGQSFRSLCLSRPEPWVQDWVPAQFPPQVHLLQHGVHPEVISEYLRKECSLGRMLGPFRDDARGMPPLHVNHFGVIPKGHNTGKWRLITDLSFPPGFSVNDGIDPSLCSMVYTTVDEVAVLASRLGRGALLAKIDIESAYRLIPVHPQDRHLQAMRWEGRV